MFQGNRSSGSQSENQTLLRFSITESENFSQRDEKSENFMRNVIQIISTDKKTILAVCDDGTLWQGEIVNEKENNNETDLIVKWKPLNSPPDGQPWFEREKDRWEKLEERIRRDAKHFNTE